MSAKLILVFALSFLSLAAPSAQASKRCADGAAVDITKMVEDLALFHIAITQMPNTPAKALALADLKAKFSEIQAQVGFDLKVHLQARIRHLEDGLQNPAAEDEERRRREVVRVHDLLEPFSEILSVDMGGLHTLDDTYFFSQSSAQGKEPEINGSGLQWSSDEKYVAFRNFDKKLWIFDTQKTQFVDFQSPNGYMSPEGPFWIENPPGQTFITNFETGERWGPFAGIPNAGIKYFKNGFVITRSHNVTKAKTTNDADFTLHDFKSGRSIHLGDYFSLSKDGRRIARRIKGAFEIVDTQSGVIIDKIAGKIGVVSSWQSEFVPFEKNGEFYIYRIDDPAIFKVAQLNPGAVLSADGTKLIDSNLVGRTTIFDLQTGKVSYYKENKKWLNKDRSKVILSKYGQPAITLIDLASMTEMTVIGNFDQFSANGLYLYKDLGDLKGNHSFYELETGTTVEMHGGNRVDFLGNSSFILNQGAADSSGRPVKTYLGNLRANEPTVIEIGEKDVASSPLGTFVVTYRDGKITLLKSHLGAPEQ